MKNETKFLKIELVVTFFVLVCKFAFAMAKDKMLKAAIIGILGIASYYYDIPNDTIESPQNSAAIDK